VQKNVTEIGALVAGVLAIGYLASGLVLVLIYWPEHSKEPSTSTEITRTNFAQVDAALARGGYPLSHGNKEDPLAVECLSGKANSCR
jgi:hypothetical protein